MSTTRNEGQLAHARRRIDQLQACAGAGSTSERERIGFHLEALRREEAGVREAACAAPDEVEGKIGRLTTRLDVAEKSLAADVSNDWASFAAAVEAELASWDTYLERLQTIAATGEGRAREQLEAAIGHLRARRIEVDERLAQACGCLGHFWQSQRQGIIAARDELEQQADELSAQIK
jgi:hypothetical protein